MGLQLQDLGLSLCIGKVVSKKLVTAINLYFPILEFMDLVPGFYIDLGLMTYDFGLAHASPPQSG